MAACRSCNSEIFWARGANNALMPLDAIPRADGNVVVRGGRAHVLAAGEAPEGDELLYVCHFSTCKFASLHRKKPAAEPPPAGEWGPPEDGGPKQGRLF